MHPVDYDLIIIGGGFAGLTAGMYASRARLNTLLIEKIAPGGQILLTDWLENYPGFPEGLTGADLVQKMTAQVQILEFDGFEYVIEKNLLAKFKPIRVDFNYTGFRITGGVDYGASYFSCGTTLPHHKERSLT